MENPIENNAMLHLVTFRLDRQLYALPIEPIQQIIEMVTITPVPQVRASVEGVINYHGTAVPVVNLRVHLQIPKLPLGLHTPIMMVYVSERLVGLIVDEVLAVVEVSASQINRPQDILPEALGDPLMLRGLFHSDENTILVLDIEHLFAPQDSTALAEAAAALPGETHTPVEKKPALQDVPHQKRRKPRVSDKGRGTKGRSKARSLEGLE
jgi:purine-binding chemotaxis protein CheW